jgi:hypothetical protein
MMNETPPGAGACCLPNANGLTYLKIGPKGNITGMQNLEVVFQQLYLLGRQPQEASDEELVGMARKFNYIPRKAEIETDYAVALRKAYTSYFTRQEKKT